MGYLVDRLKEIRKLIEEQQTQITATALPMMAPFSIARSTSEPVAFKLVQYAREKPCRVALGTEDLTVPASSNKGLNVGISMGLGEGTLQTSAAKPTTPVTISSSTATSHVPLRYTIPPVQVNLPTLSATLKAGKSLIDPVQKTPPIREEDGLYFSIKSHSSTHASPSAPKESQGFKFPAVVEEELLKEEDLMRLSRQGTWEHFIPLGPRDHRRSQSAAV